MKKNYLTGLFAIASFLTFGQTSISILNANNVNATIADNGFFFSGGQLGTAGYEVPAGSGNHALYSGSFWFGGTDVNGQLKLVAQQYEGSGVDYTVGPTTRYFNQYADASLVSGYFGQTIWMVSKSVIDYHIANYQNSNYTIPAEIASWPAHGDTSIGAADGMLPYIAPFVDVNGDGFYEPSAGDYPCIKGDVATFSILNDAGALHMGSFGEPIFIELHCMFYQYNTIPELDDVTFVDIEVVNMGTQTIYNAKASFFLDPDLGNFEDDYIGTDVGRNMVYVYNGDDFDEASGGMPGYGVAPPAVGIKLLSDALSSSMVWTNGAQYPMNDPTQSIQFYHAMNGDYLNGDDQLDGNGNPTDFAYEGEPTTAQSWSEYQQSNIPGDRRCLATLNVGDFTPDMSYGAAARKTFSYAIIYAKGTDHLNSVTALQSAADVVQNFHDNLASNCFEFQTASISETPELEFSIAPNPSNGQFTIHWPYEEAATAEILDAQGRKVKIRAIFSGSNVIDEVLGSGIYFVNIISERGSGMQRLVIK